MKRKAAILLILMTAYLPLRADIISPRDAQALADRYFGGQTKSAVATLVWSGGVETKGPYAPAYYVFNGSEGGFVVIAGDDRARPILAWSDEDSFEVVGMPDQIRCWFDEYAEQIADMQGDASEADAETARLWEDLRSGVIRRATTIVNLNTANWNQTAPYNRYCPTIGGKATYTGCVATAISELMYFYKYPAKGHGTLPDYSYTKDGVTYNQPGHELTAVYDWDNMLHTYKSGSYTDAQANAAAQLIFDVGVMVKATYGTASTGASTIDGARGLIKNFDYDSSATHYARAGHTESEWFQRIKESLDKSHPIAYTGYNPTTGGGHSFLADGYDSDERVRFNWGWGGSNNGFYYLSALKPSSSHNYNGKQSANFDLRPDAGGRSAMTFSLYYTSSTEGLSQSDSTDDLEKGDKITIKFSPFNTSYFTKKVYFRVWMADYWYTPKYYTTNYYSNTFSSRTYANYTSGVNPEIKQIPAFGDRIAVYYAAVGSSDPSDYTPLILKNNSDNHVLFNPYIPAYDHPMIHVQKEYKADQYIDFYIDNTRAVPDDIEVVWYVDGKNVTDSRLRLPAGKHTIKAECTIDGVTTTYVQRVQVQ